MLKEDMPIQLADGEGNFNAGAAHAANRESPQFPDVVRGEMLKAQKILLPFGGMGDQAKIFHNVLLFLQMFHGLLYQACCKHISDNKTAGRICGLLMGNG